MDHARVVLLGYPPHSPALPDKKAGPNIAVIPEGKYNRIPTASPAKARFSLGSSRRPLLIARVGSSSTPIFEIGTPPVKVLLAHVLIRQC